MKKSVTNTALLLGLGIFAQFGIAKTQYSVPFTATAITIDGTASESQWQTAQWKMMDQLLLGDPVTADDFQGRFKLLWDASTLYLMAEIKDDVLSDVYHNPLDHYWADECLEVFIDEDASGGIHTYNYNAFAYHVALDNQSVDIDTDKSPQLYNDHIQSQWKQQGDHITWELAISVYGDDFVFGGNSQPKVLTKGKKIGFMLAWCDADGKGNRESFIGSEPIAGENKDLGYIDASVFGHITLTEE